MYSTLPHIANYDDAVASVQAMRLQEENGYRVVRSACQLQESSTAASLDIADCRLKMAEWCYQVVEFCKFQRETVSISMSYLDRFLASPQGTRARHDAQVFQLASMTCLYTAVKIHEPEAMQPATISSLSRGVFSVAQVEEMERCILQALSWRMNPPTAQTFCAHFLALTPQDDQRALELTKFQAELAVKETSLIGFKPSSIAFAAFCNTNMEEDFLGLLAETFGIDIEEVVVAQELLYKLLNGSTSTMQVSPSSKVAAPKGEYRAYSPTTTGTPTFGSPRCVAASQ